MGPAVSNPASRQYHQFLTPGQVARRFGTTVAERSAVAGWLRASGLRLTHSDPFNVTVTAEALGAGAKASLLESRSRAPKPGC